MSQLKPLHSLWIKQLRPLGVLRVCKATLSPQANLLAHRKRTLQSLGGLPLALAVVFVNQVVDCWLIAQKDEILLEHVIQQDVGVVVLVREKGEILVQHRLQQFQFFVNLKGHPQQLNQTAPFNRKSQGCS